MNLITQKTILGGFLALALGATAAIIFPHSATHLAVRSAGTTSVAPEPAQIDGPLVTAYRAATGSNRWLLVVSAAEHAAPAEMSTLIRMVRDDPAAVRMLAAHWAELDPVGMFTSLYADYLMPDGMPGTLPSRQVLSDVLIEYWSRTDLPAAIKALTEAPSFSARDDLRRVLANSAMNTDPETGLRLMAEWNIRNFIPQTQSIGNWAARDPQHAVEVILKSFSGNASQAVLMQIGNLWGKSDPAGGLRFAATLDPRKRTVLSKELMRTWASTDLKSAAAFASAQMDVLFRNSLASGLVETWGKSDPAAALAWSQDNLKGVSRASAIANVIKVAAEKSLTAASQLVSDMEPGADQNSACVSIFETWFAKGKDERAAALDWVASLPDPTARTAALEKVQWIWMWSEPDAVRDFIASPHGDLASQNMINQVAHNQAAKNPEAALKWADGLPTERALTARRAVFEGWLQIRPEAATAYARNLPTGSERESAIRTVTQSLVRQAPERTLDWLKSLPAADQTTAEQILDQNGFPPTNGVGSITQ